MLGKHSCIITLLAVCMVYTTIATRFLRETDYAVDIAYQSLAPEDPLLHFTIRSYVQGSSSYAIHYNVTGIFEGESYSHANSGSSSSNVHRPNAEYTWYSDLSEEDILPGAVIMYWVKVKARNVWYRSMTHTSIVGQESPTSLRLRSTTTTTPPTVHTTRRLPVAQSTTLPPPTPRRQQPTPARTPQITPHHTPTPKPTDTSFIFGIGGQKIKLDRKDALHMLKTLPIKRGVKRVRRGEDSSESNSNDSPYWNPEILRCLQANNYTNYAQCTGLSGNNRPTTTTTTTTATITTPTTTRRTVRTTTRRRRTTTRRRRTTTTTTQKPPTTSSSTTSSSVPSAKPTGDKNRGDGNEPTKKTPKPETNEGDLSGQQADSKKGLDLTIVLVSTIVPAVIMVGLIIIAAIVVKNRRGREEPDPYQQVFNNMNYNSTMEIASRRPGQPALPPPRGGQAKLPTEETDYSYADHAPDNEIYEAISHVDYELNGTLMKPRQASALSQKSSIRARAPSDWGSDEYEDPTSPQRISPKSQKSNISKNGSNVYNVVLPTAPNLTYGVYQDPTRNTRSTLATTTVSNTVNNDSYQDPSLRHTLPPHFQNADNTRDPAQTNSTTPPSSSTSNTYEVPGNTEQDHPSRQYSVLRREESGNSQQ